MSEGESSILCIVFFLDIKRWVQILPSLSSVHDGCKSCVAILYFLSVIEFVWPGYNKIYIWYCIWELGPGYVCTSSNWHDYFPSQLSNLKSLPQCRILQTTTKSLLWRSWEGPLQLQSNSKVWRAWRFRMCWSYNALELGWYSLDGSRISTNCQRLASWTIRRPAYCAIVLSTASRSSCCTSSRVYQNSTPWHQTGSDKVVVVPCISPSISSLQSGKEPR